MTDNAVETEAITLAGQAKAIVVDSDESYVSATDFGRMLRSAKKRVGDFFTPMKRKADDSKREILAQERKLLGPLEDAQAHTDRQIAAWNQKKELERQEAQRAATAAAQKEAEDKRIAEAVRLEKLGKAEAAQKLMDKPIVVAPVVVASTLPKVEGLAMVDHWKFRIVNADAIPRDYCKPDDVKIGGVVRATKGTVKIEGIEIYNDPTPSQKAA